MHGYTEDNTPVIVLKIPGPAKYASHLQSLLQQYLELRAAQYIRAFEEQEAYGYSHSSHPVHEPQYSQPAHSPYFYQMVPVGHNYYTAVPQQQSYYSSQHYMPSYYDYPTPAQYQSPAQYQAPAQYQVPHHVCCSDS